MDRENIIKKNISLGIISKGLGIGLSYLSIPIILNYLGERNYGIWITIFSILSWIYNFDVGIGNGLKNKLTESLTKKKLKLAKEYISTSYIIIFVMTIFLLIIGIVGIYNINISKNLNIDYIDETYMKTVVIVSFLFTLGNFIMGLYKQLYYSVHESGILGITNIIYQLLIIILVLFFKNYYKSSLVALAFIYGISNFLVGIIFTILFFKKRKYLIPDIKYFNKKRVQDIFGVGIEFFIIQLSMIIIFTTDNILITKYLDAESVTNYSIISQMYKFFLVIVTIILAPFWALFTSAYINKDKKWIFKTLKKFNCLFILLVIVQIVFTINIDFFIKLWIGKIISYPRRLPWYMMLSSLIMCFAAIYMYCLNGFGKIRLQLCIYTVGAMINIPLSIYFIKRLGFRSDGVILATNISIVSLALFLPIQVYKLTKNLK